MIWAELGDCRRFSSSRQAVRHTGIDITVYSSDGKRSRGHLARQGPPLLRWALFESALCCGAAELTGPRLLRGGQRTARQHSGVPVGVPQAHPPRAHHTLRELGDDAWEPVAA